MRNWRVGDRVFSEMITCLRKLTGQDFKEDVNNWVEWFNANADSHPEWMQSEAKGVSKDVLDEYRALMKKTGNYLNSDST